MPVEIAIFSDIAYFSYMEKQRINNQHEKVSERKTLRTDGTLHEAVMWKLLKARQVDGLRFRRQFSIGPYILDFYCPECKLAIELDGQNHFSEEGLRHDYTRDKYLKDLGITVLHFENKDIFRSQSVVLEYIRECIQNIKSK